MVVSPTAKDRNGTMVVTLNVSVKTLPLVSTDVIRSKGTVLKKLIYRYKIIMMADFLYTHITCISVSLFH